MTALADDGFLLLAGPLAGSEHGRLRALLIVDAESEAEIRDRIADDPWAASGHLRLTTVEPWNILVGTDRLDALIARS
ncbi:MAG: YciI family protein [Gaiellaceae bacterium]